MLSGLFREIIRRRLWPIPVAALLVAVAAPLMFLKPSSTDPATSVQATKVAPDAAPVKQLPVRARQLLKTKETPKRHLRTPKQAADPFQGPASATPKATTSASTSSSSSATAAAASAAAAKQDPVPVVITDATGKKTKGTISTSSDAKTSTTKTDAAPSGYVAVDVRYEKAAGGPVRRAIPRLQPFTGGGRVVASFVKYSPTRNKATFAISPNTIVTGSAHCRKVDGLCRYVDLAAGKHVQLFIGTPAGKVVSRRLTVVRIRPASGSAPRSPLGGACLLNKLSKLGLGDPAISSDACS
jgi:hypothetical protein